ncbi:RagB/SusD family nutrient uptake outer membrane protein [Membranihabitans marinus]|uniref:RagB/SusD family nutrient uptake outer membrane protein n=1 Tax=Membranihabitans marinus TaxID=1227546 RepID=UPI001F196D35|nr:RagB/SusD family nutrient uptake outer membrane protein [Membranihabitans marinus]
MKKLFIYFIFLSIVTSCSDSFLDRPPLDATSEESYWRSSQDLENYIVQFYEDFPTHLDYQNGNGYNIRDADNAIVGTPNSILNGERGSVGGTWRSDWTRIRAVNLFFDNYERCEDDYEVYKSIVGEAHFFRARYYFELVKKYGDVAWYDSELSPNDTELLTKPREPRTVIVDHILADLDQAVDILKFKSEVGNNRINKEMALAFKTRIALYEGTWQKYHANTIFGTPSADPNKYFQACVDAAEELINNGDYQVGLHNDYYEMFGLDDMNSVDEILFCRSFSLADGVGNDMQYATINNPNEVGVTWSLVTSYLDKEGHPYDYLEVANTTKGNAFLSKIAVDIDPRLHASVWAPGDLWIAKDNLNFDKPQITGSGLSLNTTGFQLKKGSNPHSPGAGLGGRYSETGYILFRYGEVLLNYAEALNELNGQIAYTELNQLRARIGMPEFTVQPQSADPNLLDYGYPISDALYEIRRERRVELALEGLRSMDYMRWAAHALFKNKRPKGYPFSEEDFPDYTTKVKLDENGLIDFFQTAIPNGYQFRENQDYLSPIPTTELTLNKNLVQNPGW